MARAERFEDLIAWQKARELTRAIYRVTKQGTFAQDRGLCNQIQRASVSIMSNIAEGFERNNPGDFHRFLVIAKASCGEVRSQLYVALDSGYLEASLFTQLSTQALEVSRIIGGLVTVVAQSRRNDKLKG
ncbi:MAG: four helix bundle protein [Anaerolinea sp.]|nr:four helix bundle protein [Anaerolinea sp.]